MSPRLTILLSLWNGWRPSYRVEHVRTLARQVREFTRQSVRIALLTDDEQVTARAADVDEVRPMPEQSPLSAEIPGRPNCFRRIKFFDPAFSTSFGTEWVASLDLDALVMSETDELLDLATSAPSGLAIIRSRWEPSRGLMRYNGGFFAIRAGSNGHVHESFSWRTSPTECAQTGWRGSDQVWITLMAQGALALGPEHGVYFYENHLEPPPDARPAVLVTFSGIMKPWSKMARRAHPQYFDAYQRFATA